MECSQSRIDILPVKIASIIVMVTARVGPSTVGSSSFNPDSFFKDWEGFTIVDNDNLEGLIKSSFGLSEHDDYVYHAVASVTLSQVQRVIGHGPAMGLHAWYLDADGKQVPPPPHSDVTAYTSVFSPTAIMSKALIALSSNAKKYSIRAGVAENLESARSFPSSVKIPRFKNHINPYLDLWSWSCHNLEWAGPDASTVNIKQSHHILPVFYHHFGCVCPSFEALETIKQMAKSRSVLDIGSGNGYWSYMLRRHGVNTTAVDNGDSLWRTMWIGDTIKIDGAKFLANSNGGQHAILLLVYPQVSGDFTRSVLSTYRGDTICVAGTQNRNGFTGFGDMTIDHYFETTMSGWAKVVQSPLPSFPGKDEALFVFQRHF